jgi:uncharacterized membrane protein
VVLSPDYQEKNHMFSRRSLLALSCLSLVVVPATLAHAAGPPTFLGIGHLPNGTATFANGVSGDGRTFVGAGDQGDLFLGVRWTIDDGLQSLGILPGGRSSSGRAVSGDGSVIAGHSGIPGGIRATRWTSATGFQSLSDAFGSTQGWGISSDGATIVGSALGGTPEFTAFRWNAAEGMVLLPDAPNNAGRPVLATDLSDFGSVIVGGANTTTGTFGFRWTPDQGTEILGSGSFSARSSFANAVSNDGQVIVGQVTLEETGVTWAARWTAENGMTLFGEGEGVAHAVNANGSLAVGRHGRGAALFHADGSATSIRDLLTNAGIDLTGWDLVSAAGISDDGSVIVGSGTHNGLSEAWIAIIPTPTAATLMSIALLASSRRRRN